MRIIRDRKYLIKLQTIMLHISKDSVVRAIKFQIDLDEIIDDLSHMPYKFRESIYFNNIDIRDLIFKGYIVPYKINTEENRINIIGINKYQEEL